MSEDTFLEVAHIYMAYKRHVVEGQNYCICFFCSCDRSVFIVVRYGLGYKEWGESFPARGRTFSLHNVQAGSEVYLVSCTVGEEFFPQIKRPGRETGKLPPPSAQFNNSCIYLHDMVSRTGRIHSRA
jgi:hypothetical protein